MFKQLSQSLQLGLFEAVCLSVFTLAFSCGMFYGKKYAVSKSSSETSYLISGSFLGLVLEDDPPLGATICGFYMFFDRIREVINGGLPPNDPQGIVLVVLAFSIPLALVIGALIGSLLTWMGGKLGFGISYCFTRLYLQYQVRVEDNL
jgi:hypothetical protein